MIKTVACLAGDGVGPELMAAATRALERVSKLHQLELDDRHFPFGGEAVTRPGHPLPAATRAGVQARRRDPGRVAGRAGARRRQGRPGSRVARRPRAVGGAGDLVSRGRSVTGGTNCDLARLLERGFPARPDLCVGESTEWREAVEAEARAGADSRSKTSLAQGSSGCASSPSRSTWSSPSPTSSRVVDAAAHFAGSPRRLPRRGFRTRGRACSSPARVSRTTSPAWVVDPRGMLLTASLMLAEGLKRRSASRTLERAVEAAERRDAPVGRTRDRSPTP